MTLKNLAIVHAPNIIRNRGAGWVSGVSFIIGLWQMVLDIYMLRFKHMFIANTHPADERDGVMEMLEDAKHVHG